MELPGARGARPSRTAGASSHDSLAASKICATADHTGCQYMLIGELLSYEAAPQTLASHEQPEATSISVKLIATFAIG